MQKKRFIKSQSGRSMVEILAVLSIVGVLAVSGISGYQYAMRRYRIAETYDEVSVTVGGGRTWPILDHYGPLTKYDFETMAGNTVAYVVPVREVVSKVNYRSDITADEVPVEPPISAEDATRFYNERREYESFTSKVYAPVWTRAETEKAWSVRVTGLSYELCEMLVTKRELGYDYVYPALRDDSGNPLDPYYHDFPLVEDKYSNEDIKNHDNVKKLCEVIDPKHSGMPPVYTFMKDLSTLNKEGSKITSVGDNGECSASEGIPSVRCLAYHARVDEKPLQTLVFYWGKGDGDSPEPLRCTPGTQYYFNGTPTEECCETETDGSWINGVCCELQPDGTCTGNDIEGNPNPKCVTPLDIGENCCIKGTPWYVGDVNKLTGTCKGDCPEGPESQIEPDQEESQLCCEMQAGGRWVLKPGNKSSTIPPKSSNPKSSSRRDGGALCCANSPTVLQFNNTNPMSCNAPNIWSKEKVKVMNGYLAPLTNSRRVCTVNTGGGSGSNACPDGYVSTPAADTVGTSPGEDCVQRVTALGYHWCCPVNGSSGSDLDAPVTGYDCDNVVSFKTCADDSCCVDICGNVPSARLLSDGVCCCDGTGGDTSDQVDSDSADCYFSPPVAMDIYGEPNTDCCEQERKNGYIQTKPMPMGSSEVTKQCCEAMNLADRTTPQRSKMTFETGKIGSKCMTECCDGEFIDNALQQYRLDPAGKFSGDIFVNYAGKPNAAMCCQYIGSGDASKFEHPACCEVDLANDTGDEAGRWSDRKTLTITVYNEADDICTMETVGVDSTCCHPRINGQDMKCAENLGCCDATNNYNNPNNMNSPHCCKLIPYHHWDNETGKCIPCKSDTSCGDPDKCTEVDDETCCIKNQGDQCFAPYAWNPKTGSVYITEKCCPDCPKDVVTKGDFLGFTKSAKALEGKIIGNCVAGFSVR